MSSKYILHIALLVQLLAGCKKFIEVDVPVTSVNAGNVYNDDATATSVLTDIYSNISVLTPNAATPDNGIMGISLVTELTGDNFTLYYQDNVKLLDYYQNTLRSTSTATGTAFWTLFYPYVYRVNAAMEGLTGSSSLSPAVKQQLLGECYFFRGFFYYYLVNLYGDVPLILTTDYQQNTAMTRTGAATVYQQIIADLKQAQTLLNENYVGLNMTTTSAERIRVNKGAATALLARVNLFAGDNAGAEEQATAVISNSLYTLLPQPGDVFLKNSTETIWALQPVASSTENTWEPRMFILTSAGLNATYPVYLSDNLVSTFAPADKRIQQWINKVTIDGTTYNYPYKYKAGVTVTTVSEYEMVLRLAEQYLIRADARAMQSNLEGAVADLNVIRNRAGLSDTAIATQAGVLDAILAERRKEFFSEWGQRWFDLKRTGKIDAVMTAYAATKGTTWESYKSLFPLSQAEINLSPNMKDAQNPGY